MSNQMFDADATVDNLSDLDQLNSAQDGLQRATGGLVAKECASCREVESVSHFFLRNDTEDGYSRSCKACIKSSRHKRPLAYRNSTGSHRAR